MKSINPGVGSILLMVLLLSACGQSTEGQPGAGLPIPPKGFVGDARQGVSLFQTNCAVCHGQDARGSLSGPPLIHRVYEPNHHSDLSFFMAVKNGTRQHHWQFGDMPPITGVTPEQVAHIVAYVRGEQRRAGIYN